MTWPALPFRFIQQPPATVSPAHCTPTVFQHLSPNFAAAAKLAMARQSKYMKQSLTAGLTN